MFTFLITFLLLNIVAPNCPPSLILEKIPNWMLWPLCQWGSYSEAHSSNYHYLQLSLNCFIMFDTFSNLWTSRCGRRWQCEMTRNVARSNSKTSSASIIFANWFKLCSSSFTFGISLYTMEDQACWNRNNQHVKHTHMHVCFLTNYASYTLILILFCLLNQIGYNLNMNMWINIWGQGEKSLAVG